MSSMENLLGLYEKALPRGMDWPAKLKMARQLGFDFLELSVDESDDRLFRLYWTKEEKRRLLQYIDAAGTPIMTMCFSGHRRYPLGSRSSEIRRQALELMEKAMEFAKDVGIRVIQLAGYDVYYEEQGEDTKANFLAGLKRSVDLAEKHQVMLAIEIMDTPFMNSIQKYMVYDRQIQMPWLTVYPDLGNLSAWGNDLEQELELGYPRIVAVHVKETKTVTDSFAGQFRDVPFGEGDVDFVKAFKKLKALRYKGPFVIEMWGDKMKDPMAEITRSRQFVLDKLREGGF
ncbi:l-ribulose-5-phosphate 3-epimerase [Lucifera butyrica]|uniref:L-ribulose-5-phosphate 3-epimerase n=2 Tax=Lucifera butyrica TaxID=1351585 RepID=A0A498RFV5_9FIRM|nr:l-ribulose-5-phosphate 3-epimerase [Lucifera butyrica]